MNFSDKLNELSYLSYFVEKRRKKMKNFIIGGLVLYTVGISYLFFNGGVYRVRSR